MIEIKVPLTALNRPLSPNVKAHHMTSYLRKKRLRDTIKKAFLANRFDLQASKMLYECSDPAKDENRATGKKTLRIEICYIHPRMFDYDNLVASQKATIDIIADIIKPGCAAGRADADDRFQWKISQEKGKPKEYALLIKVGFNEMP